MRGDYVVYFPIIRGLCKTLVNVLNIYGNIHMIKINTLKVTSTS